MNLKKYPNWQKYIRDSYDKKLAYKTFAYWEKLKKENIKTKVDFNLLPKELKLSIMHDYVNQKYLKYTEEMFDRYGVRFSPSQSLNIAKVLVPLKVKVKDVLKMTESLILSNHLERLRIPEIVSQAMSKFKWFYSLKTIDQVTKEIESKAFSPNIRRINDKLAVQLIETREDLIIFASPSWCTNYSNEQINKYYKKYTVLYIWEETEDSVKLYGVNLHKNFNYIENIFDYLNRETYDAPMRERFKKVIGEQRYQEHIEVLTEYDALKEEELRCVLLMINLADDHIIENTVKILNRRQINKLLDILIMKTFPLTELSNRLIGMLIKNRKLDDLFVGNLKNDHFFDDKINGIFINYFIKNKIKINNPDAVEFLLKSIALSGQANLFKKLKEITALNMISFSETMIFYNQLNEKEKLELKKVIKIEARKKIRRIFSVLVDLDEGSINKSLFRFLVKHKKIDMNDISIEMYMRNESALDLKLKTELFKNTDYIDEKVVGLMKLDHSLPGKEITKKWIDDHKLTFQNAKDIPIKWINKQYLNKVYTEDDFFNDRTTENFEIKLVHTHYYYDWRYWMKSNEEYISKIVFLLESRRLSENKVSSLFQTKNKEIYTVDLHLMKEVICNDKITLTIKNKVAILNELISKRTKEEDHYKYELRLALKTILINDLLLSDGISKEEAESVMQNDDLLVAHNYVLNFPNKLEQLSVDFIKIIYQKVLNEALDKNDIFVVSREYLSLLKMKAKEDESVKEIYDEERNKLLKKFNSPMIGLLLN